MSTTSQAGAGRRIVRFGLFEADLQAGELRKRGLRIRLQDQPFQVLALLLERPGEIVSREDLRAKLWPADTFVDFDHSLNTAINKIREALGDEAPNPRFVETVARRGYRFIAPVHADVPASAPAVAASPAPVADTGPQIEETRRATGSDQTRPTPFHEELEVPLPHRAVTRGLFALIQVMYLVFYVLALFHWEGVDRAASTIFPDWGADVIVLVVWLTALLGIPLRLYLISAVAFDHRRLGNNFRRLFLLLLPLDQLWATAPFLIASKIGLGAAFAATAALMYVPFSERTLIRLAYPVNKETRLA
jgi:DNA-binding winged helix-turn-helix (wHTH) protein